MITEERLKELVKERKDFFEASIFDDIPRKINVKEIDISKPFVFYDDKSGNAKRVFYNLLSGQLCSVDLERIFETEEDAKFALKFKRIPKTEYLDLPTWEEFNKDNFGIKFYNKSREFCLHRVRYSASDKNPLWKIDLYESYGDDEDTVAWKKSWDLTKENYLEACEVARKLWLGEEV